MPTSIDYYFSLLSPFTYLAGTRLETIAARHGAAIRYRPFDIMKVFAETGGVPLGQRHWSRQEYRLQELRRLAKHNQMSINLKPAHWPTDPAPASAVLIAAQQAGQSIGLLSHAFLRAVWHEEKNIADQAVIDEILAANDVDTARLAPHMADAPGIYAQNTQDALANGVFGAPFYILGTERFWGQDRLSFLDAELKELAEQGL
ncbi:MAG: 2-hydroxychromene-2-carboxylate isomerase [Neomegalonema sp.]|nr:2-hydroxychromene-2-carboxylate isomerase [Neomegalonema sp.]